MLFFVLVGFGMFHSFCAYAQKNFVPGYVIDQKGDTIPGFVDYRNWRKTPKKIQFRYPGGDSVVVFEPFDIAEFGTKDEIYVSAVILSEVSSSAISSLDKEADLKTEEDTVFLQTVFRGHKHLYYYQNEALNDNFYIKPDTSFLLLGYKIYSKNVDGQELIAENKMYLRQLAAYFSDCPSINARLNKVRYERESIRKVFQYYMACTGFGHEFEKEREKIKADFGVLAGASLGTMRIKNSGFFFRSIADIDYNVSENLSFGLFFDLTLPRNQGKWSLSNALLYNSYEFSGINDNYFRRDTTFVVYAGMGYSYVKLMNLVRFVYPAGKFHLYVNAGISNGFGKNQVNYRITRFKSDPAAPLEVSTFLELVRNYEQGLVAGAGVKFGRLAMDARIEMGNGMSLFSAVGVKVNRFYLLAGYRF